MASGILEAWRRGAEVNLFLLGHLAPAHLADRYDKRTRDVGAQFAHMHAVRLRWLRHAAPELVEEVADLPKDPAPTKAELAKALRASGKAVERFLCESEAAGKVRGWNGGVASFLGYLLAHEAHHRGLVAACLRASGHKLPQAAVYGQWDWGKGFEAVGARPTDPTERS